MNSTQKTKWWLDAILFTGFLLTFFLDLTGLIVHQWLGVICGALALVHLAMHWNWVKAITLKYWKFTNNRSQLYYLIDLTLFGGLFIIIGTGVVMSTWLDLALANYDMWHTVHVISSAITLAMLMVKVGLHWRWIASALRSRVQTPVPAAQQLQPQTQTNGRREFLKVMGVTSVAAMFALGETMQSLRSSASTALSTAATDANAVNSTTASEATYTITTNTPSASSVQPTAAPVSTQSPTATSTAAAVSGTGSTTTTTTCSVRCGKGCSYPGHCRKYTDSNGNGKCDLGECA